MVGMLVSTRPSWAGDPGGTKTGLASDAVGMVPGSPTQDDLKAAAREEPYAAKLTESIGQNRVAINFVWLLFAGFLVMFMQAGFSLVETGFCRAKNAAHVMMTNFMIYPIGMIGFWICGFALMFGAVGGVASLGGLAPLTGTEIGIPIGGGKTLDLFALKGFFLNGDCYDVGVFAFFLFQMVFMDTACTIPTGAMAERWRFSAFIAYGFFMSMFLYPLFGNWAWGGGWLADLGTNFGLGHGYVDFAGSGVVHAVGGFCGLAGAIVLGPRIGKYDRQKRPQPIPGHNIPMALLGTFILAFGWFGFNPGSTLAASGGGALRIGIVATVTMLASASGALAAMVYWWKTAGKPDPSMCANGMLAGLVAITAPSGFVNGWAAFIIGAVAGLLVCVAVRFFEHAGVDDPVGAISVHGVCGVWGLLSVGLFADGTYGDPWNGVSGPVRGLLYGDASQLAAQVIGAVAVFAWAFGASYVFFRVQKAVMGIRSRREDELAGLDIPEMGTLAYPYSHISNLPVGTPVPADGTASPQPRPTGLPAPETT
ncbi:MAG: ammonium transporter [Armatimonadetes bacterium]|nr:ammonium transporter [Armatimonadota bacterium]